MNLMPQKSVMTHDFSKVPHADIPRSVFNRSHGIKTTADAGYLVPFFVDEALPGDTFNMRSNLVVRQMSALEVPLMDNIFVDVFYFAVPNRLVWSNFQKFMGEQTDPGDSTDYTVPVVPSTTGFAEASLYDYFGLPPGVSAITVNNLHGRAYNLIWNEWFRDQNLQDSVVVDKDDGPDDKTDYVLLKRGKRHDYFTSCLPWPQKGTAVELPLGTSADIKWGDNFGTGGAGADGYYYMNEELGGHTYSGYGVTLGVDSGAVPSGHKANLYADLSTATAATINSLREAFQLQRLMERDARGGTRYTEIVNSHFGVTSPDARLQRPEYLGGGSFRLRTEAIAGTNNTSSVSLGVLAAQSFGNGQAGFTKSFVEHCVLIGLINVRADITYQTGINRMWSRQTKWDYYWPALAHLGEQEVYNKEIYAQGDSVDTDADGTPDDDEIFGYQERWAEYKYKPSEITGMLRSNATGSLDIYHLSQDFASLPVLNASFIVDEPPIDRIQKVDAGAHFVFDVYHELKTARPMPMYSVPGLIDHF